MTVSEFLKALEDIAKEMEMDISNLEILITDCGPSYQYEVDGVFIHTNNDGTKVVLIEEL